MNKIIVLILIIFIVIYFMFNFDVYVIKKNNHSAIARYERALAFKNVI